MLNRWIVLACVIAAVVGCGAVKGALAPGLKVTFFSGTGEEQRHSEVRPNFWIYVSEGEGAHPFIAEGPFRAVFEGVVSSEIRSVSTFHASARGLVKLKVNGELVLEGSGDGERELVSQRVRLNRGTNQVQMEFASLEAGPAFLRLRWAERRGLPVVIPSAALEHAPDRALEEGQRLAAGRELVAEFRCIQCHKANGPVKMPELAMDAPAFDGIGSRRERDWMERWILDPRGQRENARMPQMFHGRKAAEKARAAAAFLSGLKGEGEIAGEPGAGEGDLQIGKDLFETLHCAGCHGAPGKESGPGQISLEGVDGKFPPGALAAFLQKPEAHYRWIRMPNFGLSRKEAQHLAVYLRQGRREEGAQESRAAVGEEEAELVEVGRGIVMESGCLNCHALEGARSRISAPGLDRVAKAEGTEGCLAVKPEEAGNAPWFGVTDVERRALAEFLGTDRASLGRAVAADFAQRQSANLNCRGCHGKLEGFPAFDVLGGKLKPEWSTALLAGEVSYKPRPWLKARMPAYPAWAEVGRGLATLHGYAPESARGGPVDLEKAEAGRELISTGGFSCVACHGVKELKPLQELEGAGINFVYAEERLLRDYFERWLLEPRRIDPTTKMPDYFDEEGRSPLFGVYNGDGFKQIEAMWQYLRLGEEMPLPEQ